MTRRRQRSYTAAAVIAAAFLFGCRSTLEQSGLVSPDPVKSDMFITKGGGFVIHKVDADTSEVRYTLSLERRNKLDQPLKLEATFENPEDRRKPLVITQELAAGTATLDIKSPPIAGLKPARAYEVVIRAYDASGALLGTHRQLVQSIIGMKGSQVQGLRQSRDRARNRDLPEVWEFQFDGREWQLGHQSGDSTAGLREYVLSGETVKNWSELVTSMYIRNRTKGDSMAPRALYEQMKRSSRQLCPSMVFTLIEESDNSILFEYSHEGCKHEPPAHYLMRVDSEDNILAHLYYAQKTRQLVPEVRQKWIAILKQARLRGR